MNKIRNSVRKNKLNDELKILFHLGTDKTVNPEVTGHILSKRILSGSNPKGLYIKIEDPSKPEFKNNQNY